MSPGSRCCHKTIDRSRRSSSQNTMNKIKISPLFARGSRMPHGGGPTSRVSGRNPQNVRLKEHATTEPTGEAQRTKTPTQAMETFKIFHHTCLAFSSMCLLYSVQEQRQTSYQVYYPYVWRTLLDFSRGGIVTAPGTWHIISRSTQDRRHAFFSQYIVMTVYACE